MSNDIYNELLEKIISDLESIKLRTMFDDSECDINIDEYISEYMGLREK